MLDTTTCAQCDHVAAVIDRFVLIGTDGPVEHLKTSCVNQHILTVRTESVAALQPSPRIGGPATSGSPTGRLAVRPRRERARREVVD